MTERYSRKAAAIAAFLLIFTIGTTTARASISVSPVRVDLSNDVDKGVIHVVNQRDIPKSYQVEVVAWTQSDERREIYSPTQDLVAVPPLFTLQPGEEQLIRVGMLGATDVDQERSYRMFITEIFDESETNTEQSGVRMRLRFGVPVFVAPDGLSTATLDYVDSMKIDDQLMLRFRNNGNTHIKILETRLLLDGQVTEIVEAAVVYILPGQSGYVPIQADDDVLTGSLTIVTDTLGSVEYELPFTP